MKALRLCHGILIFERILEISVKVVLRVFVCLTIFASSPVFGADEAEHWAKTGDKKWEYKSSSNPVSLLYFGASHNGEYEGRYSDFLRRVRNIDELMQGVFKELLKPYGKIKNLSETPSELQPVLDLMRKTLAQMASIKEDQFGLWDDWRMKCTYAAREKKVLKIDSGRCDTLLEESKYESLIDKKEEKLVELKKNLMLGLVEYGKSLRDK